MSADDEATRLRIRDFGLLDELTRCDPQVASGSPCLVARTTTLTTYPSTAQVFYACEPLTVLGAEVEGGLGVVSVMPGTFFALNLGGTVPPVGTEVLVSFTGNRWVFRYDA